jgi:hypothetical protein
MNTDNLQQPFVTEYIRLETPVLFSISPEELPAFKRSIILQSQEQSVEIVDTMQFDRSEREDFL